jgi:hypothetical protein
MRALTPALLTHAPAGALVPLLGVAFASDALERLHPTDAGWLWRVVTLTAFAPDVAQRLHQHAGRGST